MEHTKQTPTTQVQGAGVKVTYKGSNYFLSRLQTAFFLTLSNGKKHSSHRLMQMLHTSDPRKEIQYLRRKGFNVRDEWVSATKQVPRHKLYWIDPEECMTN